MDIIGKKENIILIIEDSRFGFELLKVILGNDYDLLWAKNGTDALKMATEENPDIILTSVVLPGGMDGYDIIKELQSCKKTKEIPVIFITGRNAVYEEEKALKLGAVDFISKPFDPIIVKLRIDLQKKIVRQMKTIKNQIEKIEAMSITDMLTGLLNRRWFDDMIKNEWEKSKTEQIPTSILVIDIDKFKTYNDTYGHVQGDEALKTIAKILDNTPKTPNGSAVRWGGEEFIVFLPAADSDAATKIAEQIRETVEETVISAAENVEPKVSGTKVTVSIGVNTHIPRNCTINEFIKKADDALYQAKENGRNQVVSQQPSGLYMLRQIRGEKSNLRPHNNLDE